MCVSQLIGRYGAYLGISSKHLYTSVCVQNMIHIRGLTSSKNQDQDSDICVAISMHETYVYVCVYVYLCIYIFCPLVLNL